MTKVVVAALLAIMLFTLPAFATPPQGETPGSMPSHIDAHEAADAARDADTNDRLDAVIAALETPPPPSSGLGFQALVLPSANGLICPPEVPCTHTVQVVVTLSRDATPYNASGVAVIGVPLREADDCARHFSKGALSVDPRTNSTFLLSISTSSCTWGDGLFVFLIHVGDAQAQGQMLVHFMVRDHRAQLSTASAGLAVPPADLPFGQHV